jgi:predicted ATPase
VAAVDAGQVLLERDAALERIDQRLCDAVAGRGSLLVLEGPAGIGKTRLALAAAWRGGELGLATFSARGSELERDFAYGLVRQLFEAPVVATSPPERVELLAGAAGRAAGLFAQGRRQSFRDLRGRAWRPAPAALCWSRRATDDTVA